MAILDLPKPDYAHRMKLIGHSDQGGRPDGVQLMVNKGHAFIGHMFSKGFSVIDVRDPRQPEAGRLRRRRRRTPGTSTCRPTATCSSSSTPRTCSPPAEFQDERDYYKGALGKKVGTADAGAPARRNWTAGMAVYDISNPAEPRQIGFMPVEGGGIHRIWYTGGRWAYARRCSTASPTTSS